MKDLDDESLKEASRLIWWQRMIARHGSREKVQEIMRQTRSKVKTHKGGGFNNPETVKKAIKTRVDNAKTKD